MKTFALLAMGLLSFLLGCGSSSGPYEKKKGEWYYKDYSLHIASSEPLTPVGGDFAKTKSTAYYQGSSVSGADLESFVGLSDQNAKDKSRAFWCDTHRDSKEYWGIKHIRIDVVGGVDAASFHNNTERNAQDNNGWYHEGVGFLVKDAATFTLLERNFAKDKISGYVARGPIAESDGSTFGVIGGDYSKDARHVFYSGMQLADAATTSSVRSIVIPQAEPATFVLLEDDSATDAGRVYYAGRLLENSSDTLRVMKYDYAVSTTHVYYRGEILKGADAATFEVLPLADDAPTAKDKNNSYSYGKRLKK